MKNAAGQTDLETLQRRLQLAEAMAMTPTRANTPIGQALYSLAQILSARKAGSLQDEVSAVEKEQRSADLAALGQILQGGDASPEALAAFSNPQYAEMAMMLIADRNKPRDPISVPQGGTLVDPTTFEVVAQGSPRPPSYMYAGIPGVLVNRETMQPVDVMNGGTPNPANPMGISVDPTGTPAPVPAPSIAPSLSDFRETPQQARQRDAEASAERERRVQQERGKAKQEERRRLAESALPDLLQQNEVFMQTLSDPNFAGAVGPMDQVTGRVGALFGSEEGVLGERVDRLASSLILSAASALKGTMSDKDLELLEKNAPGRGSSEKVWRDWYSTEYLPRVNRALRSLDMPELSNPFREKQKGNQKAVEFDDGTKVEFD